MRSGTDADRGGTVLLSSHLLHEIEVIADDIVVIGNGRIVAQGTKSDLLQAAGSLVRAPDATALGPGARRGRASPPPARRRCLRADADPERVGQRRVRGRPPLIELRAADGAGLEEMFLELTADTQREGAAA